MSQTVQVLVYDLTRGMAAQMSPMILGQRIDGVWHTGVQVFDREYYYGGGIQCSPIGMFARSQSLPPVRVHDIGVTTKTKTELEGFLRSINHQFTAMSYDLLRNNCNNFSDAVCMFLLGQHIPTYIIDLPNIVFNTPGGAAFRPMIEQVSSFLFFIPAIFLLLTLVTSPLFFLLTCTCCCRCNQVCMYNNLVAWILSVPVELLLLHHIHP